MGELLDGDAGKHGVDAVPVRALAAGPIGDPAPQLALAAQNPVLLPGNAALPASFRYDSRTERACS